MDLSLLHKAKKFVCHRMQMQHCCFESKNVKDTLYNQHAAISFQIVNFLLMGGEGGGKARFLCHYRFSFEPG